MPILEAQMVGLPVITSDLAPMKDVAGAGGDPSSTENVESIRQGIEQLLENHSLYEALTEKGLKNQSFYQPHLAASSLTLIYTQLLK